MASAQQPADAVERVVAAAAVPGVLALDAPAYLVHGGEGEPHDVEGIEHPYRVGQRGAQGTVNFAICVAGMIDGLLLG
jgi:hypothetical protein